MGYLGLIAKCKCDFCGDMVRLDLERDRHFASGEDGFDVVFSFTRAVHWAGSFVGEDSEFYVCHECYDRASDIVAGRYGEDGVTDERLMSVLDEIEPPKLYP